MKCGTKVITSSPRKTHCSSLQEDDGTVISKLVHSCGRDSVVPTVFAVEALQAGSETTGLQSAFLLYHVARCSCCPLLLSPIIHRPGDQTCRRNYTRRSVTSSDRMETSQVRSQVPAQCSWRNIVLFSFAQCIDFFILHFIKSHVHYSFYSHNLQYTQCPPWPR